MQQTPRLIACARSLRSLVSGHHRSCSTKSNVNNSVNEESPAKEQGKNGKTTPVDREISLFGPKDHRAPLPGNVGPVPLPQTPSKMVSNASTSTSLVSQFDWDILTCTVAEERHASVIFQYMENTAQIQDFLNSVFYPPTEYLECRAQECPQLLRKDFATLFPGKNIEDGDLTVIIFTQKSEMDANLSSSDMDDEKEELAEHFITASEDICNFLNDVGYWADFIHPSSGRPHLGPYTNDTFFETDERYRHFGFTIEDVGECKVMKHHLWGTHTFVGSIFTNAPAESPELKAALIKYQWLALDD